MRFWVFVNFHVIGWVIADRESEALRLSYVKHPATWDEWHRKVELRDA